MDIANCRAGSADIAALNQAVAIRQDLGNQLSDTTFAGLPNAIEMSFYLRRAWELSVSADEKYLDWSQSHTACGGSSGEDANQAAGDNFSGRATTAKQAFLILWNPIAAEYGLSQRDKYKI